MLVALMRSAPDAIEFVVFERMSALARRCREFAPAGESLSLAANEGNQSKAALLPASLRCASGNLRCSVVGCAAKLLTRYALQSNSCRESDHEVWSLYGAQTQPTPCAPRRWQKGGVRTAEVRDSFFGELLF